MANKLEGKVAIITGAASGMGKETAILFAKEGAKIVIGDINEEGVKKVAEEIGENAVAFKFDVSNKQDWEKAKELAHENFGKINALVNNAGICDQDWFDGIDEKRFRRSFDINTMSVFYGYKTVYDDMKELGGGSIVNISSVYGLFGQVKSIAYCASKFAVTGLTKAAAKEFAKDNIRVNSIHPGAIATPMCLDGGKEHPELLAAVEASIPMGHLGEAIDIANGVLYLISDEAKYTTGAQLIIDGAWNA